MSEENAKKKKFKTVDIVYIGLFAALIAVCAWISIPMTVSFTLQTCAVCLTAGLLGWKRGTLTVIIYILLGMIGLPVFTGFKSGIAAVTGPTGGYIVGFIFTALIVGFAADKLGKKLWMNVIFMAIGILVCYLFGTIWFMIAYKVTFASALTTCVVPFLIPDAVKIAVAAILVNRLKKFVK
ncbi:MAG: biotin transporter BioY [Eubacterium sp.]|nr:biotin transporter BioY [Eubacterium sp.]